MEKKGSVLVFSLRKKARSAACAALEGAGLEATPVSGPAEFVRKMRERPFDLLLVDAAMREPSVVEFLGMARDFMPDIPRAVFETASRPDLDLRELTKRAEPAAVFAGPVDAAKALVLIERRRRSARGAPPASGNTGLELDWAAPDMTEEMSRILDLLLEEPDIRLPVLPRLATEVRKLLAEEDASFAKVADVVALDPGMSARLLEVANSPLYSGIERIKSLKQAVSRIGTRETRNVLLAVSVENLFSVKDRHLTATMDALWMHSLACAYSNEIMAKDLGIEESGDFFMMGLLHDIGKLLIIHLIQQGYERKLWTRLMITDERIGALFQNRHNALGARLITKWDYDDSFRDVVLRHNDDVSLVRSCSEPVVVTFFSNLMTRKMGFSLLRYPEDSDPLDDREIAQALNMSAETRGRIEQALFETVNKIRESYK